MSTYYSGNNFLGIYHPVFGCDAYDAQNLKDFLFHNFVLTNFVLRTFDLRFHSALEDICGSNGAPWGLPNLHQRFSPLTSFSAVFLGIKQSIFDRKLCTKLAKNSIWSLYIVSKSYNELDYKIEI